MGPDEKPVVVVKAPLAKIIWNPNHLTIYQDRVNRVNRLVTAAYLFSRYIFVHSDDNDDNDDAFNADIFMTDSFFMEVLQSNTSIILLMLSLKRFQRVDCLAN